MNYFWNFFFFLKTEVPTVHKVEGAAGPIMPPVALQKEKETESIMDNR